MSLLRRLAAAGLLLLPGLSARAQSVPFTASGIVSITGGPAMYNGKYVIKQSDFGFFWLDTQALSPGHVQAESKCTGFQPTSDTDIYVIGDCNGITNVSTSGNYVLVRQFNGQCFAATKGCNGPRDDNHQRFTFELGTFNYLGDLGEIPDSTQTTDPQGRTWSIQPLDANGRNFVWIASGQANSPPIANAFATNLSATGRADKGNYYGDKWQLQDASSGGPNSVTWDFNYTGSFVADESGSIQAEGVVVGYFPCDPANGGNIRTAGNCRQSLGLANPPASASWQFAEKSANQFGTSANAFVSSAFFFSCPQVVIAGYSGFTGTCNEAGGTLTVATGGSADASATKGNLSEATLAWTFTFPAGPPSNLQGPVVNVPAGATGFVLTATFPGGYQATATGAVSQTPALIASFTAPAGVVRGSAFPVTNQMTKPASTTLNSVDWLIAAGACGAPPPIPTNPVASSFLTVGGAAQIIAPNSTGSYCIYLKYNYTTSGSSDSVVASRPVTVTEWVPAPAIGIYLDAAKTQSAPFVGNSFFLNAGTTYYLFDEEAPPPPGANYPGAQWRLSTPAGDTTLGSTAVQASFAAQFLKSCSSGCSLKLTVGAAAQQVPINVGACAAGATNLCLNGGRFSASVAWATSDGRNGAGQATSLTSDTGYFWFFTPNNIEMVLKVVDGRALNSAFWVFAGGLTNVQVTTTVIDTVAGTQKTYVNPQGTAFQPIQDTSAFPAALALDLESGSTLQRSGEVTRTMDFRPVPGPIAPGAACTPDATTLCLNNGRFKVQVQWTTPQSQSGAGQAVPLTSDTGYFWFFSPNNVEMVLKVVNGCAFSSTYWVFAGGLTNVNVVTTVTDTQTGTVKTYTNPQGTAFQPLQDTSAFPSCP
ncbi:MAG TPA: hypothetical protein VKG01_05025 [Thermoanaerobaculia bacterium]|nr:hypothetical protein [Thermoanaerobaculia bacterium]